MTRSRVVLALSSPSAQTRAALFRAARDQGYRAFVGPIPRSPLPREEWFAWRRGVLWPVTDPTMPARRVRTVASPGALARARRAGAGGLGLVIRWRGDRVIPLEALVADESSGHRAWVLAERPEELPAALGALERGAERVLISVASLEELARVGAMLEPPAQRLAWTLARLLAVRPVGLGERVIVDTTRLLDPREGLLVGSSARLLFHVNSEALGSSFSAPRPFRVNAGSPHLYVLMADGSTRYLSELAAGDTIAVARPGGGPRAVRVGRLKIERRPMMMVVAATGARQATLFVQEAETVRLSTLRGAVPVTRLAPPANLRGVRLPPGRHLGRAVEEAIEER